MRARIYTRLERLEAQARSQQHDSEWIVHIDTIGRPEDAAEALRAEARRLAMPEAPGRIGIFEVSCPTCPIEDDWAERGPRLQIWGQHPDATKMGSDG